MSEEIEEIERRDRAAGVRYFSFDPRIVYRWLRRLFGLAAVISVLALDARAADVFCGVDTDQSGTASNPCPAPDADGDGYPTTGYTGPWGSGIDCNDSDFFDFPGQEITTGCNAGQYKTCQSDGTYTACSDISAFTCHTGSGATYWFAHDAADCTSYTYNSPANWFCFSNTGATNYHAPVAGDCFVFKAGSYTGNWSGASRQIYVSNKDGTSNAPIILRGAPGTWPVFNGTSSSPTEVDVIQIADSDYWTLRHFAIDGSSDYSGSGIHMVDGAGRVIYDVYIKNIDGESDNNSAGIKVRGTTGNGISIHHTLLVDNYERGAATNQNSGAITIMDDTGTVTLWNNVVINSTTVGHGIWIKHADDLMTPSIRMNFVKDVERCAIGSENKDTTVTNNWIKDCTTYALEYGGIGSTSGWFKDSTFSYNTVENCAIFQAKTDWDDSTGHASFSGTTIFTAAYNIMSDNNASYDGDEGDGVSRMCEYNCTSGERAAASGKAIWANNVYYSSGTTDLRFGYFGQAGGGADYAGLTAWQTAGFDVGSVQADPSLDADGISATYPNHGWRAGLFTAVTSTGSSSSSGRTLLQKSFDRRRRK